MRSGSQNNVDRVKRVSIKGSRTTFSITAVASWHQRPLTRRRSKIVQMEHEMALGLSLLPKRSMITSRLRNTNIFLRLWMLPVYVPSSSGQLDKPQPQQPLV